MKAVRLITKDEMIGVFLSAELYSSRFRRGSLKALSMFGLHKELIESPNYSSYSENNKRAKLLGLTRGWPDRELFQNFPQDVLWQVVCLNQSEFSAVRRLKSSPDMPENLRLLSNAAAALRQGESIPNIDPDLIAQIAKSIEMGQPLPPVIMVSTDRKGKRVLIEGHSRSLAYCLADPPKAAQNIEVILGLSYRMVDWPYY